MGTILGTIEDNRTDELASGSFDITAITRLKHADLWEAAKKLGGQAALARYLGLHSTEVGLWVNLKRCPPAKPTGEKWTEAFLAEVQGKLGTLTGLSWDELWPPALRNNIEFLQSPKTIEKRQRVEARALANYAARTSERLVRHGQMLEDRSEEQRQWVDSAVQSLTERERQVIGMRFGLDDGVTYTQVECGKRIGISAARVAQIEWKAMRKLRQLEHQNVV